MNLQNILLWAAYLILLNTAIGIIGDMIVKIHRKIKNKKGDKKNEQHDINNKIQ